MLIIALFGTTPDSLRNATGRYCEAIWQGWYDGKTRALESAGNPFVGGPKALVEAGITAYTTPGGDTIAIKPTTRIRARQLSDESLAEIGAATGKDLVALRDAAADQKKFGGQDIVHPEYVGSFEENCAVNASAFANNAVAGASALNALVGLVGPGDTVDTLIEKLEAVIGGSDAASVAVLNSAVRNAWIGRAVTDGSWKDSGDFVFDFQLTQVSADLDEYVVVPVLKGFLEDLKKGYYNN